MYGRNNPFACCLGELNPDIHTNRDGLALKLKQRQQQGLFSLQSTFSLQLTNNHTLLSKLHSESYTEVGKRYTDLTPKPIRSPQATGTFGQFSLCKGSFSLPSPAVSFLPLETS